MKLRKYKNYELDSYKIKNWHFRTSFHFNFAKKERNPLKTLRIPLFSLHRNDVIRTRDLFVPNEALYQAEPHSDNKSCWPISNFCYYTTSIYKMHVFFYSFSASFKIYFLIPVPSALQVFPIALHHCFIPVCRIL